jgi:transposase
LVAVKSMEQQGVLMLHKTRDLLVRQRTMLINALRGHLVPECEPQERTGGSSGGQRLRIVGELRRRTIGANHVLFAKIAAGMINSTKLNHCN